MPTMTGYKRLPKFYKLEGKPANASSRDLENAQPIYIDGLEVGDAGVNQGDFEALQAQVGVLEGQVAALEAAVEALTPEP